MSPPAHDPSRFIAALHAIIHDQAGFRLRAWDDVTAETAGPPTAASIPAHSIQRLGMGDAIDEIIRVGHRNRDEDRLVSIQAVFERPLDKTTPAG